ncbi:glycosyl hydrolase catalytic core-domain-containing protein [Mrakia frigida]|uniref:glycosyl hydrolase catalytic core-domain-containing protein n=1 Tax=Mrakia frigida TaxID=29902 RepID=UPI003FCC2702
MPASFSLPRLVPLLPLLFTLLFALVLVPTSANANANDAGVSRLHRGRHLSVAGRRAAAAAAAAQILDSESKQTNLTKNQRRAGGTRRCKARPGLSLGLSVPAAPSQSTALPTSAWIEPPVTTAAQAPPPPIVTQAPATPPPPPTIVVPPPSVRNGKFGLAWPNGQSDQPGLWESQAPGASVITWSSWIPSYFSSNMDFIPMLWGPGHVGEWEANIPTFQAAGVTKAAFFNEANNGGQANVDPWTSCEVWKQHFGKLRDVIPGIRLLSMAPDNSPSGKQWLLDFQAACPNDPWDVTVVHWYGNDHLDFQAYVTDFINTFGKPVAITEYACHSFSGGPQCSWDYVRNEFFEGTAVWANNNPMVETIMPFGAMQQMQGVNAANQLMYPGGEPSDLGWKFLSL